MSRDLRETKEPPGKNISQGRNMRKFLMWKNAGISSEKKGGQDGWSIVSRHHICVLFKQLIPLLEIYPEDICLKKI